MTETLVDHALNSRGYAPDFELCRDLNASALAFTPAPTMPHIITQRRDLGMFSVLRGPRTQVWSVDHLLPEYMVAMPGLGQLKKTSWS